MVDDVTRPDVAALAAALEPGSHVTRSTREAAALYIDRLAAAGWRITSEPVPTYEHRGDIEDAAVRAALEGLRAEVERLYGTLPYQAQAARTYVADILALIDARLAALDE